MCTKRTSSNDRRLTRPFFLFFGLRYLRETKSVVTLSEASYRRHMMLIKKWLMFIIFILWYSTSDAINCNFLTKNQQGFYVESFGPCDPSASYCASRVVTTSGWQKPIIELFEWYCENEYNVTSYLRTSRPPNQGCFTYARDEHLCFCKKDLCNTWQNIHDIFLRYSNAIQRVAQARNANQSRQQRQRIQKPEIGRQISATHTTAGRNSIGWENTQRRDRANRVILRTIGDVARRTVLARQEKQRLLEFRRQQAIRLEAEKDRRAQQKEHEEALREDNRRRYALKLAQREKENQKKEEILKHAKEEEMSRSINKTLINKSNEWNEKKINFDGIVSDITADNINGNVMIEPAHIVFVNTSNEDITH